ncbi:MAG: hypothetical protein HY528_02040 [Chloroflexi bacterium]|nr:hypothetical protein [Chloroflexota bacterium]
MGKRDFGQRETKKSKKDARKIAAQTIVPPPAPVEVIKRGKKPKEEEF